MIRFILRRQARHISGAETSAYFTLDADLPALERLLDRGGAGEDTYDYTEMVDAEVLRVEAEAASPRSMTIEQAARALRDTRIHGQALAGISADDAELALFEALGLPSNPA